ncbi:unnamed protein product, partial [Allacma fusca]
MSQFELSGS